MTLNLRPGTSGGADAAARMSVQIHEGIPDFAEAALEALYECHMTTLLRFQQYYQLQTAKTYVAGDADRRHAVLVFRIEGRSVFVYNEQITIRADVLAQFVQTVFGHYPQVRHVSFYAVDACTDGLPFPRQKLACLEDISLSLPDSVAAYENKLGKSTLQKIKRGNRKLLSDFASVRRDVGRTTDISEETVRRIVELSRMRMAAKGQSCFHTEAETRKLIDLVRRYGVVGTVTINGEIGAGAIMLRIGSTYCLQILSHHPDYDRYNLGTICCYDGIAHAIASGGLRFNFGWGTFDYKYRLLGQHTDLYRIDIYRTPLALAADAAGICKRVTLTQRRNLKRWMARPTADEGALSHTVKRALHAARALRANLQ